jgi:hypothetical protein
LKPACGCGDGFRLMDSPGGLEAPRYACCSPYRLILSCSVHQAQAWCLLRADDVDCCCCCCLELLGIRIKNRQQTRLVLDAQFCQAIKGFETTCGYVKHDISRGRSHSNTGPIIARMPPDPPPRHAMPRALATSMRVKSTSPFFLLSARIATNTTVRGSTLKDNSLYPMLQERSHKSE